jgi:hypothetical protein
VVVFLELVMKMVLDLVVKMMLDLVVKMVLDLFYSMQVFLDLLALLDPQLLMKILLVILVQNLIVQIHMKKFVILHHHDLFVKIVEQLVGGKDHSQWGRDN